ncbi:hypothetical protein H9L15_00295 [Sphingomonas daechungensis]|uniref:Uncharacterized protein n=1 Tax=Sphingomonas daechungensis TaxID=1176646 RepID=A0ABX6T0H8_9SPHN|nr:hypothetical protein H9L15_00295 [Sphingomonas daechungensis]
MLSLQLCHAGVALALQTDFSRKRKQFDRRTDGRDPPSVGQKAMADDLRLLFQSIVLEPAAQFDFIAVSAEGMAHQRQVEPASLLCLPDVCQFVNEQALSVQGLLTEVLRPQVAIRVEVNVPGRSHDDAPRLQWPPLAPNQANRRIINGIAEDRTRELDLAIRQGT